MNIRHALSQYIRGAALLPYYVRRIYENTLPNATEHHKMTSKHAEILSDLAYLGGQVRPDKISLDGLSIHRTPPRAVETMHEVLVRGDYDFSDSKRRWIMIDIGMNVGITTIKFAANKCFEHVYSFEPLRPTFKLALDNISLNPEVIDKITPFNVGLSDCQCTMDVQFALNDIMSVSSEAVFDECFSGHRTTETIQLQSASTAIGAILERHPELSVFLKIDCEGAEFKIIEDLDKHLGLSRFRVIIIEWHNKDPQPILEALERNRFFYFLTTINVKWNVGLIKAVRRDCGDST
jgi:FkbM family methyltransferase